MNREYIAQNLCENKEDEDRKLAELEEIKQMNKFAEQFGLRCAGSCQLKKQLAEAENQQEDASVSSVKYTLDVLFIEKISLFVIENQLISFENPAPNGFYHRFASTSNLHGIFRPPVV